MTYVKQNWENLPSENTPITAGRLSHMETQYDEAMQEVDQKLPISRGTLPTGTNLNLLRLETDAGSWHIAASNTYLNGPTTPAEAVILTVEVGNTQNAAKQTWTESGSRSASMYYRKLVTPTGDGGDPLWTPWEKVNNSSSLPEPIQLSGLAQRDGWLGLYDPSNLSSVIFNSDGTISRILDSLGNLPPLVSLLGLPVTLNRSSFGVGSSVSGPMVANLGFDLLQPASILMLAKDNGKTSDTPRTLIGSGTPSKRFEMRLGSTGNVILGAQGQTRTGTIDKYFPGVHVWESYFDTTNSTISIDGALAHRGLPASASAGTSQLYVGCLYASSGVATNPWGGEWGAIAIRSGNNDTGRAEINRMRERMMGMAEIPRANPWLWPEIRAYSMNSLEQDVVMVGDPDQILDGGVASITKLAVAILARETLDTDMKLDEVVEVLAEDEFIINTPNLVAGDRASYRVLLQSMLIPSNNTAPRTIARLIGETYPGAEGGQTKFLARMNERFHDWGYDWSWVATNPGGSGRFSMRQLAKLLLRAMQDPVLAAMCGTARTTVSISGPNARTVDIENTWVTRQTYGEIPEWVGSKDGTGTNAAGSVFMWDHPDGTQHVSVMQSQRLRMTPTRSAASINNSIIEADKNGGFFNPTTPAASFVGSGSPVVSPPVGW